MSDSYELCARGHYLYEHGGKCLVSFEDCHCQSFRPDAEPIATVTEIGK